MINLKKLFYIACLFIGLQATSQAQHLEKQFDKLLSEQYLPGEPGATGLVAIDGKIVYHKAFGMANLELNVPMEPGMVFEIGSITKQFTAVSILMLMEQGRLNLDDDITKYIEDYPTHDRHISIHHLLTHTSGIKSYTSMASWAPVWRTDLKPIELIDFFKNEPMDFNPGEEWKYNNSAYIILGYIIEAVSGQTYEQFVESNIFKPLGMRNSYYGSNSEIINKRAYGYQKQKSYVNAEYLSFTQPYAAGSLMSTVEDLFIWNRAIRSNKLVRKETIALAFTNYSLINGKKINYGYGWGLNEINGSPTIEHAGGIFGFVTNAVYLPDEDVFVAVFSNCDCNGPGLVSTKMAAIAIEKPYPDMKDIISVNSEYLEELVGVYDFEDSTTRTITLMDNQLYSMRTGSTKFEIFPTKKNIFFFENSLSTLQFNKSDKGIEAIFTNRINKTKGVKTNKTVPVHNEIQLSEKILEGYTGVYALTPYFSITITLENGKLMSQATGQEKFQIFAESKTKFFYKVVDARLEFLKNDDGNYESFILYQNGLELTAKRND